MMKIMLKINIIKKKLLKKNKKQQQQPKTRVHMNDHS